jgi:NAD(P)-dependent dehydrogenase (short-subunit alcohol dehydrogenase family)
MACLGSKSSIDLTVLSVFVQSMDPLDALLLNHGSPLARPFLEVSDEAWEQHFQLMVLGPLRVLRAAVPLFRRHC